MNLKPSDYWSTPMSVIDAVRTTLNLPIALDACATRENRRCYEYISEEEDAFSVGWVPELRGFVFCNPPYSQLADWVERCAEQAVDQGQIVVGLVPCDTSTRWFHRWVMDTASILLVPNKRIAFINPETNKPISGNPKGSLLPVWTPWNLGRTQVVELDLGGRL